MVDTQRLKESCDLRRLVEQDLGAAPLRGGRAHLWKCPFHHEQKGFSLAVWANGYRCFGRCDASGDVLDWLQQYRHLTFMDAIRVLGEPLPEGKASDEKRQLRANAEPPLSSWQEQAKEVVSLAEETLWSTEGEDALAYLTGRGLTTSTIRKARLGYVPGDWRESRSLAGLEVPCGITIPWFAVGALWTVKVRRAYGIPKYLQIKGGSAAGLYGADALSEVHAAVFCEGEFDTLIVQQEAGSLAAAVTLGSAANPLTARWLSDLTCCRTVLVAYDTDEAGVRGAKRLAKNSPRFHPVQVPHGKDITEFYLAGGDVYFWIEQALR